MSFGSGINTDLEDDDVSGVTVDWAAPNLTVGVSEGGVVRSGGAVIGLSVTTLPLYEYRDLWAEESGATGATLAEWSFGNGATGFIGLPFSSGWELIELSFHADTYAATASIEVDLMNYGNIASNAAANAVAQIALTSATDGGGTTNNAFKVTEFAPAVAIPDGSVLGFITRNETGNISDARVGARFRRKVGDYVSAVELT